MMRRGRRRIACAVALPLAAMPLAGCTTTGGACDCATGQITISVPADIASSVTIANVHVSGPACTNVTVDVANQTNGGTAYDFTPNAAGECDVEVDSAAGVFTDKRQIIAGTSCCPGFYSTTTSTIDVPEPAGDAG